MPVELQVPSRYEAIPDPSHDKILFFSCLEFCQALGKARGSF